MANPEDKGKGPTHDGIVRFMFGDEDSVLASFATFGTILGAILGAIIGGFFGIGGIEGGIGSAIGAAIGFAIIGGLVSFVVGVLFVAIFKPSGSE